MSIAPDGIPSLGGLNPTNFCTMSSCFISSSNILRSPLPGSSLSSCKPCGCSRRASGSGFCLRQAASVLRYPLLWHSFWSVYWEMTRLTTLHDRRFIRYPFGSPNVLEPRTSSVSSLTLPPPNPLPPLRRSRHPSIPHPSGIGGTPWPLATSAPPAPRRPPGGRRPRRPPSPARARWSGSNLRRPAPARPRASRLRPVFVPSSSRLRPARGRSLIGRCAPGGGDPLLIRRL